MALTHKLIAINTINCAHNEIVHCKDTFPKTDKRCIVDIYAFDVFLFLFQTVNYMFTTYLSPVFG